MDYTLDDFLSETLYELSSCIIQRDYPIDVFRKKLESAISKGFQINYRDNDAGVIGYPLLIRAIWGPYPTGEEIVKVLIEHGADPNIAEYPNGEHALDEAIRVGSTIELIEFIIDSGADVNSQDKFGCTAFSEAALSYIYENPNETPRIGDNFRSERLYAIGLIGIDLHMMGPDMETRGWKGRSLNSIGRTYCNIIFNKETS